MVLSLLAAVSPGPYVAWWKAIPLVIVVLLWARLVTWIDKDSQEVILPRVPLNIGNIRQGWVLASRVGRIRLDEASRREAMALDPRGQAIADPYGFALTSDEQRMVVAAGGTHELLVYRASDLPLKAVGSDDHRDTER